jgi:hypothetical protein
MIGDCTSFKLIFSIPDGAAQILKTMSDQDKSPSKGHQLTLKTIADK